MSREKGNHEFQESEYSGCLKTELTLGLPGGEAAERPKSGAKRVFSETVDLKMGVSCEDEASVSTPPPSKGQVVGRPPVRSYRKKMMKTCKLLTIDMSIMTAILAATCWQRIHAQIY